MTVSSVLGSEFLSLSFLKAPLALCFAVLETKRAAEGRGLLPKALRPKKANLAGN